MKKFILDNCYTRIGRVNPNLTDPTWWLKRNLTDKLAEIKEMTNYLPEDSGFLQRFHHIFNDLDHIPLCQYCGKNTVTWYQNARYLTYCSASCGAKASLPLREKTSMEHYGVPNPSQSIEIKQKIKDVMLENYGVDNYSKTDEFSTFIKQWWVDQSEETIAEIQTRREVTCLEKYGTTTPLLNADIQAKITQTLMENYGVTSPLKSDLIKEKRNKTMMDRFGRAEWTQQHISLEHLENLKSKEWVEHQLAIKSIRELAVMVGMTPSNLCIIIHKHNLMPPNYSSPHKEMYEFMRGILGEEVEIIINDRSMLQGKELDIYIPSLKIAIECDGVYRHSENAGKKHPSYHLAKTTKCIDLGIQLFHIFDCEWYSDKQPIIKSKLAYSLGKSMRKIYARKCRIIDVKKGKEKEFLNNNHIQGFTGSRECYGLEYEGELVSLMSFGKSRYNSNYEWELIRSCTVTNTNVVGGFSKLLSYFTKRHNPTSIISYCDRRWSVGNTYIANGFTLSHTSAPSYYYQNDARVLHNRLKFQKHKLQKQLAIYDPALSEWENMRANKYDRIWDCGELVFVK